MKRVFDCALASVLLILFALPMLAIGLWVRLSSPGPALYWSQRVGRENRLFPMPKFRSMRIDTPAVATHLLGNPGAHVTAVGRILRKSSLDELPQLWSVLRGDMSFVGPRPALFNQHDLRFDAEYLRRQSLGFDLRILWLTAWRVLARHGVSH